MPIMHHQISNNSNNNNFGMGNSNNYTIQSPIQALKTTFSLQYGSGALSPMQQSYVINTTSPSKRQTFGSNDNNLNKFIGVNSLDLQKKQNYEANNSNIGEFANNNSLNSVSYN